MTTCAPRASTRRGSSQRRKPCRRSALRTRRRRSAARRPRCRSGGPAAARSSLGCRGHRSGRRSSCSRRRARGRWPGLESPFCACAWRWTLTMLPSTIANSRSGSPDRASNILLKTSAITQWRNRLNTVSISRKPRAGRAWAAGARDPKHRFEEPPRMPPVRQGSVAFHGQCGSIRAHCASVNTNLVIDCSLWELKSEPDRRRKAGISTRAFSDELR